MKNCLTCGGVGGKAVRCTKIALLVSRMGGQQGLPPFIAVPCHMCGGTGVKFGRVLARR